MMIEMPKYKRNKCMGGKTYYRSLDNRWLVSQVEGKWWAWENISDEPIYMRQYIWTGYDIIAKNCRTAAEAKMNIEFRIDRYNHNW